MRAFWGILLAIVVLAAQAQDRTLSVASSESSDQRLALVIGNSAYKVGPLRNPANDARAMAAALKSAGFDVMHGENLSHRQLFEMTRDFGRKLKPGVVALFYYAGHGLQVRDRNFLIPVEADPQSEEEVPYTSVDVNFLLDVMNRAKSRVNIVILDACRNNPFARSFRSGSGGLAQMDAPSGTLIAYATAPGRVASDGGGDHGLYTQHLLKHLNTPGLPVEILFKRVREGVERETKSQQIPWESSSLKGDFAFIAAAPAAAPAPARPAVPAAAPDSAFELAFWDSIKASSQAADYQAYLAQYPSGRFAPLAKARINSLNVAAAKPAPTLAAPPPSAAPASAPQTQVAAVAPTLVASGKGPAVGERYVYQYTDLWRPGEKLQVSHAVTAVSGAEITESISTQVGRRTITSEAQWPAAAEMRQSRLGNLQLREFAPFALALGLVGPGQPPEAVKGMPPEDADTPEWSVRAAVSQEDVSVPAGRFRAIKLSLAGTRGGEAPGKNRIHTFDMAVWYAQESKRYVKLSFTSYARTGSMGSTVQDREVYELVSAPQLSAPVAPPRDPAAQVAAVAPLPLGGAARPPAVGERWMYQYTDLWKPAEKLQVTHAVTAVNAREIVEQVSATLNRRHVTGEAVWPAAATIGEWKIEGVALREFSPFALALGILKPGQPPERVQAIPPETSDTPEWSVRAVVSEEEVSVPAGRFQAVKLALTGRRPIPPMTGLVQPHHFEMTVWYAPQTSRAVKMTFNSFARVGNISSSAQHRDVYELVSAPR